MTTRASVADLVPQSIAEMRGASAVQANTAFRVAERLLRSERQELRAWGWKVAYAFGAVYAKDMQGFLLALERQRKG